MRKSKNKRILSFWAVLKRRDLIVKHINQLIKEKGEPKVLYKRLR